jgi:3-oxoacyl-[acyl-carrier protein] reductase
MSDTPEGRRHGIGRLKGMGRLNGKVAIVTGGGWNIGRALAIGFASEGAAVSICGRREAPLAETVEAIRAAGGEAIFQVADVTDASQMEELAGKTAEWKGSADILAAIAGGGGGYEAVDAIDPAWWEQVIRVNLVGTFHAVRAVLPGMREKGRGSILTCSGGGAYFPMLGLTATAYATAKAGLCRFTDQLATELLDCGVRVNCLQPGLTWSEEKLREIEAEEERTGEAHPQRGANHSPEDAAELAGWLVSDESAPLTGRSVSVDEDWWKNPERVRAVCESLHAYTLRRVELPG